MKKLILVGLLFGSLNLAKAIDAPASLIGTGALNGNYAYLWSVPVTPASLPIASASITFTDVKMTLGGSGNDISVDFGSFIGIDNVPISGNYNNNIGTAPDIGSVKQITDNDSATDAFKYVDPSKITHLGTELFQTTYTYTRRGHTYTRTTPLLDTPLTWTFVFNADQLAALNNYIALGNWGFEIDPDCHFTVGGISFNYTQGIPSVPDAAGTFGLLGLATVGIVALRRKLCIN